MLNVVPANDGTHNHRCWLEHKSLVTVPKTRGLGVWVPAFAGTSIMWCIRLQRTSRSQDFKQPPFADTASRSRRPIAASFASNVLPSETLDAPAAACVV